MPTPETRSSLILRIHDASDGEAWNEFSEIYRPVIFRIAKLKGLQDADAEDLAQQVLLSVAKAIDRWEPDREKAKFRTWLRKIAHNAILNAMMRRTRDRPSGCDEERDLLDGCLDHKSSESQLLEVEHRREVFHRAARAIRTEFSEVTWNSFWKTAVEGLDVDAAAEALGRTRGSIYASRCRVMQRLRQKVEELDSD